MGGLYAALTLMKNSPSAYRVMHSSLTLGAILIYMLNALNYRPAEGQRETDLTQTCCWNVYPDDMDSDILESDDDEDPIPVMLDYGLYFISGVILQEKKALRMGRGDTVTMDSIMRLYEIQKDEDLNIAFCLTLQAKPSRRSKRTRNSQNVPVDVHPVASGAGLVPPDAPLKEPGIEATALPQEAGPDIVALQMDPTDQDEGDEEESADDVVARIWRQFPSNIFEIAPIHRSSNQEGSQLLLSVKDQKVATIEVFQDTDLSRLFSRVVVKIVRPDKWEGFQFKRYFPPKGHSPPTRLQNFHRMQYFKEWNALMMRLSTERAQGVRDSVWNTFKTFKWLPLTDTDRLWNTKKVKATREWTHLPYDDNKPVVQIGLQGALVQDAQSVQLFVESSDDTEGIGMEMD
jgi:hypothetical protein